MESNIKEKYLAQKLIPRTISAFILGAVVLLIVYKGGWYFSAFIAVCALFMGMEWVHIINTKPVVNLYKHFWYILGVIYIAFPLVSLIYLRDLEQGFYIVLWLVFTVWASDIGAYIFGIAIGGPKLMPSVSPSKTWSGCIGAIILSIIVGYSASTLSGINLSSPLITCAVISIVAQVGDLIESWFKRFFNVKDSGAIIPGHGGVLDRIDSIVTSATFVGAYQFLTGHL